MLVALASMAAIALGLGALLGYAAVRFRREGDPLADAIEKALPQTQCGQCRYPGCRPYAEAIARGEADINRCAPGGELGVRTLAQLLGRDPVPLEDGIAAEKPRQVAWIDEAACIGCTKCIQACPVDAIIGAPKLMHSVLSVECTGCELCIAPCPVDCIHLVPAERGIAAWRPPAPRQPLAALVESATVH